jgi:hypothetical protein
MMNNFKLNLSWKRFVTFLGIIGAVAQIITTVIGTDQFRLPLQYFIGVWIALTVLCYLVYSWIDAYLKRSNIKYRILTNLNYLRRITRDFDPTDNYFELLVLDWRIATEKARALCLHGEAFRLPAMRPNDFMRYVFGKLITQFTKGDKYHALSNLSFWVTENSGGSTFLNDNIVAARQGLSIERIIILDSELFTNPESHIDEIIALEKLVNEMQEQAMKHPTEFQNIVMKFYIVKKADKHLYPTSPFVTVYREIKKSKSGESHKKYLQLIPVIEPLPKSSYVQLKFEDSETISNIANEYELFTDLMEHRKRELISLDGIKIKLQDVQYVRSLVIHNFIKGQQVWVSKDKFCIAKLKESVSGAFLNIKEADGYTVIDTEEAINSKIKDEDSTKISFDQGWKMLTFEYENDLPLRIRGYIAELARIFAVNKVPILTYSCYSHVSVLIEEKNLNTVLNILSREEMNIIHEDSPAG